ncbi:MAG TPA: PD-(D/E)XK motif protein [Cytophagaceae bacterium]|jgi:hypothetical protein|nr:PD-(D/E)XK motif protein [Cytophagaceae bacterium]
MIDLLKIFNDISAPKESDRFQFSANPLPNFNNHRIAKDKLANPTILISTSDEDFNYNINLKLKNISVLYNINCNVQQDGALIEQRFTVISFVGTESLLKTYFLKLCAALIEAIGNDPAQNMVRKEINRFIEVFRLATEPATKTIQGLWAELFLISESKNPVSLLQCWHSIPQEKFDFNDGLTRVEVKSSGRSVRVHNFSLEQLNPISDTITIVASLFVKTSGNGRSIEELSEKIVSRLDGRVDLIEKLHFQIAISLGREVNEISKQKFDWHLAKDSLKYYNVNAIPKIAIENVPPLVSEVKFNSDLSLVQNIDIETLRVGNSLLDAL